MWPNLRPIVLAAALLLVVGGAPKVRDPGPLVRAVRAAGLPLGRRGVRCFALVEVVVGGWVVAAPTRVGVTLLAALYAVFSGFVWRALAAGTPIESCGCFGTPDTPPSRSHLAVTAGAALVAAVVAVAGPVSPWSVAQPAAWLGVLALAVVIAFLAWQVMAALPTTTPAAIRSIGKV